MEQRMTKDRQRSASRHAEIILSIFGGIPVGVRRGLFITLAWLFYHLAPRHRLIALHNLKLAFPEKDMKELARIAWGVYRNMALVAAEFFDIPSLNPERLAEKIEVEGMEHYREALKQNKGILLFSAHFGNWELMAAATALLLKPVMVIYRTLDSKVLDALVNRVRSSTGNTPLPKERAMRPMLRCLKDNGIVGLLIDQNVDWYEGVFVDFFGRPACTTDGLALLALHTEAPVIPAFLVRIGSGRYRYVIGGEVQIVRTGNRQADVRENTQVFTKIIEEMVRKHPDQWLWVHQRWKTAIDRSRPDRHAS
jgi:KDO2-lipid IV(A) lauroyltransferase